MPERSHRAHPYPNGHRVGDYLILDVLGRGDVDIVYRARDLKRRREVALKTPSQPASANPAAVKRFLREAQAVSELTHPSIIPFHEVFEHEGVPWLSIALRDDRSLREVLRERGRLSIVETVNYGVELADVLRVAHDRGFLHRDLAPGNVMITRDGNAMLGELGVGWGLLGETASAEDTAEQLARQGYLGGRPGYMSPEQTRGGQLDGRSDVFVLGAILYEMATGRPAFARESPEASSHAVLHEDPQPMHEIEGELSDELASIVRKALAKDPAARHTNMRELVNDLRRLQRELDFDTYTNSLKRKDAALRAAVSPRRGTLSGRIQKWFAKYRGA